MGQAEGRYKAWQVHGIAMQGIKAGQGVAYVVRQAASHAQSEPVPTHLTLPVSQNQPKSGKGREGSVNKHNRLRGGTKVRCEEAERWR